MSEKEKIHIFSKTEYAKKGYKTKKQWQKEYKVFLPSAEKKKVECWVNGYCEDKATYYPPNTVRDLDANKDLKRLYNKVNKLENTDEHKKIDRLEEQKAQLEIEVSILEDIEEQLNSVSSSLYEYLRESIQEEESVCADVICIDTETTGLDKNGDELLQVSIVDIDGNTLLNEYIRPYRHTYWGEAEQIHHISPEFIKKNGKYLHEIVPKLKYIMNHAKVIVGYNLDFDLSFVRDCVNLNDDFCEVDVMLDFAEIYGDWNEYYGNFKWQKLTKCAEYYGYQWQGNAHDSLEDARATIFCYKQMKDFDEE